jgi:chemotaxis protein histidine kinase CheA
MQYYFVEEALQGRMQFDEAEEDSRQKEGTEAFKPNQIFLNRTALNIAKEAMKTEAAQYKQEVRAELFKVATRVVDNLMALAKEENIGEDREKALAGLEAFYAQLTEKMSKLRKDREGTAAIQKYQSSPPREPVVGQ